MIENIYWKAWSIWWLFSILCLQNTKNRDHLQLGLACWHISVQNMSMFFKCVQTFVSPWIKGFWIPILVFNCLTQNINLCILKSKIHIGFFLYGTVDVTTVISIQGLKDGIPFFKKFLYPWMKVQKCSYWTWYWD